MRKMTRRVLVVTLLVVVLLLLQHTQGGYAPKEAPDLPADVRSCCCLCL